MKWYEDEVVKTALLTSYGLREESPDRWVGKFRVFQMFDDGVSMVTITLPDDPRYDIETIHVRDPGEAAPAFFIRSVRAHIEEIKRRTELLQRDGLGAVENKPPSNN